MKKINFVHQFLAKSIPAINNVENPTQSMNLTGEKFFITVHYTAGLDPMPQVARYLEVLGTEFL